VASRLINGGQALATGSHAAFAVYEVTDSSVWSGRIESGKVSIVVPAAK
jgi:hypothetical protein